MQQKRTLPLIVIVGPTASGKSALALKLAKEFNGEIISADSRAIYRGLDVGTAKPTIQDQKEVPYWGIDLVDPGQNFSAKDFQEYAYKAIEDIRSRGRVPFLVGGTGLYVDAVVYSFAFNTTINRGKREKFESMSLEKLHLYCHEHNISLPENRLNKRYVINTILRNGQEGGRQNSPLPNTYIVGITTDRETLRKRIVERAKTIITLEVFDEAKRAGESFSWSNEAMTGNVYSLIQEHTTYEQFTILKEKFITLDWQLAKRQLTWFKRSEHIMWFASDEAYTYCARVLAKLNNS